MQYSVENSRKLINYGVCVFFLKCSTNVVNAFSILAIETFKYLSIVIVKIYIFINLNIQGTSTIQIWTFWMDGLPRSLLLGYKRVVSDVIFIINYVINYYLVVGFPQLHLLAKTCCNSNCNYQLIDNTDSCILTRATQHAKNSETSISSVVVFKKRNKYQFQYVNQKVKRSTRPKCLKDHFMWHFMPHCLRLTSDQAGKKMKHHQFFN